MAHPLRHLVHVSCTKKKKQSPTLKVVSQPLITVWCRCNTGGMCRTCVCVKTERNCANCLPTRNGCCPNTRLSPALHIPDTNASPPANLPLQWTILSLTQKLCLHVPFLTHRQCLNDLSLTKSLPAPYPPPPPRLTTPMAELTIKKNKHVLRESREGGRGHHRNGAAEPGSTKRGPTL